MLAESLVYYRCLLIKAIVASEDMDIPEWRFDGKAITTAEEVAAVLNIPLVEAVERVAQKDVYSGSGAGIRSHGLGTRTFNAGLSQRANALAYGRRRRRRHKRRSEK